ncbi:MAG: peptidoglycan DD-metalloendopeptidase family protein [Anaerolineae bacterium]|nr:peptidoglycan DD-metalloendopeptidase family protein [Anaerolineae bacterium]
MRYPIDGLVPGYDDFSIYRERFGGRHVGLDIGFERWGDPVHAAASGRVTLSNIEEWDTEKGVVILEHTFPDGTLFYTLYGHMEESDDVRFPLVGSCVEMGEVVGTIGWPSRGKPHLHYEIRNFLPNEGGPGYVSTNPMDLGWYNPLDFTELWNIHLQPGFISSATFHSVPALPPIQQSNGTYVIASENWIEGTTGNGEILWRVETDGAVTGLAVLPAGQVVAHTRNGQTLTLENGRYAALWHVDGLDQPFLMLDNEALVFPLEGGGLEAYNAQGEALWTVDPVSNAERLEDFKTNGQTIALGARSSEGDISWRLVDSSGEVKYETTFEHSPITAPDWNGDWIGLDGTQIRYFTGGENHTLGSITGTPGTTATMTIDLLGNSYVYLGSELLAFDRHGQACWQVEYPNQPGVLSPLMATGNGCLLYTLDADGMLQIFDTANGDLVNQLHLYSGGRQNSSPRARLLKVEAGERVQVSGGFLSMVTLDGWTLGGETATNCLLG